MLIVANDMTRRLRDFRLRIPTYERFLFPFLSFVVQYSQVYPLKVDLSPTLKSSKLQIYRSVIIPKDIVFGWVVIH